MHRPLIIPVVIALLTAGSCGPKSPVAGTYRATITMSADQARLPEAAAMKEFVEKQLTLVINNDGSYTSEAGDLKVQGTTRVEGNQVTLSPTSLNGIPVAEAREKLLQNAKGKSNEVHLIEGATDLTSDDHLQLSADGRSLTVTDPHDLKFGTTVYTKQ